MSWAGEGVQTDEAATVNEAVEMAKGCPVSAT